MCKDSVNLMYYIRMNITYHYEYVSTNCVVCANKWRMTIQKPSKDCEITQLTHLAFKSSQKLAVNYLRNFQKFIFEFSLNHTNAMMFSTKKISYKLPYQFQTNLNEHLS